MGQSDLPAIEVRKLIGAERILGVSTHNVAQARQAVLDGADYVGIGPVYPSRTKPRDFVAGLAAAREVAAAIKIPAIAIAGIDGGNVDDVLATGVSGVAISRAVIGCADVKKAARELKAKIEAFHGVSKIGAAEQGAVHRETAVQGAAPISRASFVSHARLIGILTLASRILGMARESVMSAYFGAGPISSAFAVAFKVPNLFRKLLGEGALSAAFIPLYAQANTAAEKDTGVKVCWVRCCWR